MAITLSKPNLSSFSFGKTSKLQTKPCNTSHHTQNMLSHYLWKIKVQICYKLQTSVLMKRNISCYTVRRQRYCQVYNSCSKCPSFVCTHARRRLRHSSIIASSMTLRFMPCQTPSRRFFSSSTLCSCD